MCGDVEADEDGGAGDDVDDEEGGIYVADVGADNVCVDAVGNVDGVDNGGFLAVTGCTTCVWLRACFVATRFKLPDWSRFSD